MLLRSWRINYGEMVPIEQDRPIEQTFICVNDVLYAFIHNLKVSVGNEYLETTVKIGITGDAYDVLQSRLFCPF